MESRFSTHCATADCLLPTVHPFPVIPIHTKNKPNKAMTIAIPINRRLKMCAF
jgi:hypothetical protein